MANPIKQAIALGKDSPSSMNLSHYLVQISNRKIVKISFLHNNGHLVSKKEISRISTQ